MSHQVGPTDKFERAKMTLKTLNKLNYFKLCIYFLTINIIQTSSVGRIEKLNGLHIAPRP